MKPDVVLFEKVNLLQNVICKVLLLFVNLKYSKKKKNCYLTVGQIKLLKLLALISLNSW